MAEFSRIGEPVRVPVGPATNTAASAVKVDINLIGKGITHFRAATVCKSAVRLKGVMGATMDATKVITPTTGWLWMPGMVEVLRTVLTVDQPIAWMSAMSVDTSGFFPNAATGWIELQYGNMAL